MPDQHHTDSLTYLIARLHRFAHGELEARLQEQGASVEQWRVLERLAGRDGCSMGELANDVLMNHPALTKMTDRMVANGLVHRAPDPADQRRVLVYVTERGAVVAERLRPVVTAHEKALNKMFGAAAAREIAAALRGASAALQEQL
ncbi:MAG: MarR family transcriptional regulator [Oricola sp.]